MKSFLCYSPSAPGKPGQLLEVVGDESVQMYLEPSSYAEHGTAPDLAIRHRLWSAKSRGASSATIRKLQKEADKVHGDMKKERQRQQTGGDDVPPTAGSTSPFSRQFEDPIPGSTPNPKPTGKKKATFEEFLKALDDRLAKKALEALRTAGAAHAQNICCTGKYLCPRCKAKTAAA